MPIYEYQCDACGHRFEAMQRLTESALSDCPQCEQAPLRKLISAVAFRLKGGGWYETDFKSEKKRNVAESDGESGDGKKDGKSDSKESGKPDSKGSGKTDANESPAAKASKGTSAESKCEGPAPQAS